MSTGAFILLKGGLSFSCNGLMESVMMDDVSKVGQRENKQKRTEH